MQKIQIWGGALVASLACFYQTAAFASDTRVAAVKADEVGHRFTMENLSAQWEIEEKVEQLALRAETEKAALEVDRQMWVMAESLYGKHAMAKEEYLTYRTKYETTAALVEELKAQQHYLAQYSVIYGYRVKISSAAKVSNKEYAQAYLNVWKAQREFHAKAVERYRHEHELQQWVNAMQRSLHKKGAAAKYDVLSSERKVIVARENVHFYQRRLPVDECVIREFEKVLAAGGEVDPQIYAKEPCKSALRPSVEP